MVCSPMIDITCLTVSVAPIPVFNMLHNTIGVGVVVVKGDFPIGSRGNYGESDPVVRRICQTSFRRSQ